MKPGRLILLLWFLAIVFIARRAIVEEHELPPPHAFVGSAIVYGSAALIGEFAPTLGATFAFGWTVALAYAMVGDEGTKAEEREEGSR